MSRNPKLIESSNSSTRPILKVVDNKDMSSLSKPASKTAARICKNRDVNYEQKYAGDENSQIGLGKGSQNTGATENDSRKNTLEGDTFITGVPVAPSPLPQKLVPNDKTHNSKEDANLRDLNDIEERLSAVNSTQASLRAELEAYVSEVRERTDADGERLVQFPDTFDTDVENDAKREAGWRKFISSRVLEHPNEKGQREMRRKMELGLDRIQQLDRKLEDAEMKYLKQKNAMKGSTDELGDEEPRWGGKKIELDANKKVELTGEEDTVITRADEINRRSAILGRQALLTEEEESRVSNIMKDMMEEIQNEVNMELGNSSAVSNDDSSNTPPNMKKSPIEPNAYCPDDNDEVQLVNIETKLLRHQGGREHNAPTGLVFDERRGTYILVDPQNVNAEKTKREESLKSNDVLADMRRKRMKKVKLEQIDSALQALENAPIEPVETSSAHETSSTGSIQEKNRGLRKESKGSKKASARQPTSLRAILRPVSPRQIEDVIKKAKAEVDTVVDEEMVNKLVEQAKRKIEHTKDVAKNSPSHPDVHRKKDENLDNTKESTAKKMTRGSPEKSNCTKIVVVKEQRSPSKIVGEAKGTKKKISMKKSASTGITRIKVQPAPEIGDYGSKYGEEEGSMKTSKSSKGVFEWSRRNTERYSQGEKRRIRNKVNRKK